MSNKGTAISCGLCCTKLENFGVNVGHNVLLHDVNLHIHCGELTAIIGPNGAGKTTLMRAMLGEIPHTGTLTYLDAKGKHTGRPLIAYVPQKVDFDKGLPASVLDFCSTCISPRPIWLMKSHINRQRIQSNLRKVQADHLIDHKIGTLSGGELQRVLLACALDPLPDLLLLDEPVSGVDPSGMELFYDMVSSFRQQYDLSIILVSHDMTMVPRIANRLVLLNKTILASGSPAEVMHDQAYAKTFGLSLPSYHIINGSVINRHH